MGWQANAGPDKSPLTQDDVKICALCETLNHVASAECWTCGWRGTFSRDAAVISLAWARLQSAYEEVRPEHVLGPRRTRVAELGVIQPAGGWHRWRARCAAWWQGVLARRDVGAAAHQPRPRSQSTPPPNGLGV